MSTISTPCPARPLGRPATRRPLKSGHAVAAWLSALGLFLLCLSFLAVLSLPVTAAGATADTHHRVGHADNVDVHLLVNYRQDVGVQHLAGYVGDVDFPSAVIVHFFDVGQGDAVLFQGEDFTILVDAGRHDRSDVVGHLERAGVETVDLFIGTHPHADHIGQCAAVVRRFPIREVWLSGDVHTTITFERCIDAILETDAGYREPRAGEVFQIGSARIEVVHPADLSGDFNNNSIVVRIVYGDVAFLLTGDAEVEAERAMLSRGHDLSARVMKLGHHGSRTSSTAEFVAAVRPELAVYSAGRENPYGHPHVETLRTTADFGIPVYGTDVFGTIRVVTDGRGFIVVTERDGTGNAGTGSGDEVAVEPPAWCAPPLIDINTATIEQLQGIIHVGPTLAERIVRARPFHSMEDLLRVSGIAERRLADILEQGLACVSAPH